MREIESNKNIDASLRLRIRRQALIEFARRFIFR